MWGLGFAFWGLGFGVKGVGFELRVLGLRVWGVGFMRAGVGFRLGPRLPVFGCSIWGVTRVWNSMLGCRFKVGV